MTVRPKADNLPFPPVPEERFAIASLDLPWHFYSRAPTANPDVSRNPQRHYPTADLEHLKTLPLREICAPDAHVFLWITGPLLAAGAHNMLFKAWGVRPSSMWLVWIKLWNEFDAGQLLRTPLLENDLAVGTGFTTMQNAEFVVLGRIGSPPPTRRGIRQVLISNRREHSRKPDEYYRRVEHYARGNRIDMFAGADRPGWHRWGWGHRAGEGDRFEAPE